MGKKVGRLLTVTGHGPRGHCVACHRPILYGERCEGCKRELRARKRRKPR